MMGFNIWKQEGMGCLITIQKISSVALTLCPEHVTNKNKRWRGGRVAEGGGLLNRYTGYSVSWVRIPSPPPCRFSASAIL